MFYNFEPLKTRVAYDVMLIYFLTSSRLETVLQSDEAKTFLGDVLSPDGTGNISVDPTTVPPLQLTDEEGTDGDLNVSGISESDVIASRNFSTGSQSDAGICMRQRDILSPQHTSDEFLTSSGESDIDKKVCFHR